MSKPSQSDWIREALDRFEAPLVRYALRIVGDLETARDVVQDTFLKLCREDRDSIEDHLSQWLFTVCRNRSFDVHKKERRMTTATDFDQQSQVEATDGPLDSAATQDTASHVLKVMGRLPDSQQEVIRLKFQNEMSYKEIADVTGLSVSNVGFLLHVGLKRLREMMNPENDVAMT
jgi:RNA polymerase sigma-70 factor (ECF subfamily)